MKPDVDRLLFMAASGFASEADREAFLEYTCQGDESLRTTIDELLEADRDADGFFELEPEITLPNATGGAQDEETHARIGPYRLIDRLGAGGCGVVYLAEQVEPVKRKVALKIIRIGMDTESVIARFLMERESLALMNHPNIARVLDAGATASGRPYFVMELVDGERITEYCDRKRLNVRQRLELFVQVCEAIQHAHQKSVIHRDIKPSNVLVSDHGGRPVPKVIDFGIAKATRGETDGEATFTHSGQLVGTPSYMSPEQAEGSGDIDTRSDIYSLGAMLCELLTGHPPFDHEEFRGKGTDQIRTFLQKQETQMPSARLRAVPVEEATTIADVRSVDPRHLAAQLAGDLDWIVMKATEKDRGLRYETANALAMDVQRYLNVEPVLARPPSRRYRFTKLVRRNRMVFAAGGVALFGLLAGLGASTWLFLRERDARHEQTRLRAVAEKARISAEDARANEARMNRLAKAADLVRQAAVFVRYKNMEEADRLLAELEPDVAPPSLEAADTLIRLANWNFAEKRFSETAQRFHMLAHVYAVVDPTDTNANSQEWLPIAPAVIEWGEPGQYEEVRQLAVQRFSDTTNSVVAEHLLKVALLAPADAETLQAIAPTAEVIGASLTHLGNTSEQAHLAAWGRHAMALLAYRQGDLQTAEELAKLSLTNEGSASRGLLNKVLLAMIDLNQGRKEEASESLDRIRAEVTQWEPSPETPDGPGTHHRLSWANWAALRILFREAEAMLEAHASETPEH